MDLQLDALMRDAQGLAIAKDEAGLVQSFGTVLRGTRTHAFLSMALVDRTPRTVALLLPFVPKDTSGFRLFAKGLPAPDMAESLRQEIECMLGGPCKYLFPDHDLWKEGWEVHRVMISSVPSALVATALVA